MKADKHGRFHHIEISSVTEARHKIGRSQAHDLLALIASPTYSANNDPMDQAT